MPSKSYVSIELVVGVRRSIPWEYARAARLRTVLDDDDRIDDRRTRFFLPCGPARAWLSDFHLHLQRNSRRSKQFRRAAASPDLSYLYLFCVLHATDDDPIPVFIFSIDASHFLK